MNVREDSRAAGRATRARRASLALAATVCALALAVAVVSFTRAASDEGTAGPARPADPHATLPLQTTRADFFLPGTQPGTLTDDIIDPTSCKTCHTEPIYTAWRGSMMSQAGRDPLFWSAFAVAGNDAADAGEFCLRCHAPKAWFEGRSDPADGSALTSADINAGVACEVCHRMVDPVPGAADEVAAIDAGIRAALTAPPPADHVGTAMIILDPQDRRRGPFSLPGFGFHTAFQARFQGQADALAASRLCGSCHNVDNPLMSWVDSPPGGGPAQYWPNELDAPAASFGKGDLFPVERTFDEWLNSTYAKGGVYAPQFAGAKPDGMVASCQDCHLERQTGYAAQQFLNATFRDCQTTGCLPAHIMAGGNSWIPKVLQDTRWRLANTADAAALDATALAAESMLRRAATLTATLTTENGDRIARVRVTNETGHKLPTGYPEGRRMWLNLRAYDASGKLIYESAAYNPQTGVLTHDAAARVYEAKQGLSPELAAELGLTAGPTFHFALNNMTYKDNRIPPRGYTVAAFDQPGMRPVGAAYADGQYWDDVAYVVPAATARVVATLYYQTASKEYIDFLRTMGGADGATLGVIWDDSKSPPVPMAQVKVPADSLVFIPLTQRQ